MNAGKDRLLLAASGWEIALLPALGAGTAWLRFTDQDGHTHDIFRPATDEAVAGRRHSSLGMFLMVPFANRIGGGQFVFERRTVRLPLNDPKGDFATHGFARDSVWSCEVVGPGHARLSAVCDGHAPYRFSCDLEVHLRPQTAFFALAVRNLGDCRLPYGMGFHPWFAARAGMTAAFRAAPTAETDSGLCSGVPFEPLRLPINAHFADWDGVARLHYPDRPFAVELTAGRSLTNLQYYVPPTGDAVCLEPVSHAVDVVNDQARRRFGDMTVLEPGATMDASMTISLQRLQSRSGAVP
jgi:aldose 1-epimerase